MQKIYPLILLVATMAALSITACTKDEEHLAIEVVEDSAELAVDVALPLEAPVVDAIIEDIKQETTKKA